MKKSTKRIIFLSAAAIAGMYGYNRFVASKATAQKLLSTSNGDYYESKNGDVFFTKQGAGEPLLLIHDANPRSSSYEWNMLIKRLEKNFTVYTIDLLGCGRSDKPGFNYTNYLYVQLITDFIQDVIKEKTSVIATNVSASFVIMANQLNPDLFDKITLINPVSTKKMEIVPDYLSKAKQILFSIPILGTFIYNLQNNPMRISLAFRQKYFYNAMMIPHKVEDTYYESAHLGESNGRFLYGSVLGGYININMLHALKNVNKEICIIASRNISGNVAEMEEYHRINNNFTVNLISAANLYPMLEVPDKITEIIKNYMGI